MRRHPLHRVLIFVGLAGASIAVGAVPAAGQDALLGICAFPISHEFPKVHVRGHALPPAAPYEGFDTGLVLVRVTNLDTGEFVEAHANSAFFGLDDGSALLRGQTIWFLEEPVGDIPSGVWIVDGVTHVSFDETGDDVMDAQGGIVRRNICAELSP